MDISILRIIEILVYTFFLIGSFYIFLRRPMIIGYYFVNVLSFLNVGLLIYFTNLHVSPLGIRIIILLGLIILFASVFIFIFIPLHTKYMNFKKIQFKQNEIIDTHEDLRVAKVNKIIIWMIFWGSVPLVYLLLIVSKKIFLEETLSGLPTYSYLLFLIAAILMFLAGLKRARGN